MPLWRIVILINLALVVGLLAGYGLWGHPYRQLEQEFSNLQSQYDRVGREQQASLAGNRQGRQQWEGHGIIRAIQANMVLISHDEIPDLLPVRTSGFRIVDRAALGGFAIGSGVRFWLQGDGNENNILVKMVAE